MMIFWYAPHRRLSSATRKRSLDTFNRNKYHQDRAGRTRIVELEPERLDHARRLLADTVSIERVWAEVSRPNGVGVGQ
jgi:hypothetical protein